RPPHRSLSSLLFAAPPPPPIYTLSLHDALPIFDLGDHVDDLSERNAPAVVANDNFRVGDLHVDHLPIAHHVFVDGVVDRFLYEHINAVVLGGPVTKLSDIHTGSQPDVLPPVERLNTGLRIFKQG